MAGGQGFVPLDHGGFRQAVRVDFLQGLNQFLNAGHFFPHPCFVPLEIGPAFIVELHQPRCGLAVKGHGENLLVIQRIEHGGHFIHPGVKKTVGFIRLRHQAFADGYSFLHVLLQNGDFMAQRQDDSVHFRSGLRCRFRRGFLGLDRVLDGSRVFRLLCERLGRGQKAGQQERSGTAEKCPVIRHAHECVISRGCGLHGQGLYSRLSHLAAVRSPPFWGGYGVHPPVPDPHYLHERRWRVCRTATIYGTEGVNVRQSRGHFPEWRCGKTKGKSRLRGFFRKKWRRCSPFLGAAGIHRLAPGTEQGREESMLEHVFSVLLLLHRGPARAFRKIVVDACQYNV